LELFAVNADICGITYEHAPEELDVVRGIGVTFGELDGELCVVPCGVEDVALARNTKGGRGWNGGHGERPCRVERRLEQDRVVVVSGSEDEDEQDVLCHLCGRRDVEGDIFEHELTGECPG